MTDGDFILYSSGDVYTVQNGTPVTTGINIVGEQGYSPSISVKVDTDTEYVLTVQNKDGSFDTPNLFADLSKISNLIIDGGEIGS